MIPNENFSIDQSFEPIKGYGILPTVKEKLTTLAASHAKKNATDIEYVLQTISNEADYKQEKDFAITHIIAMHDDGVDYNDKEARVDEIDADHLSQYSAFYRLDMIFRSEDGICNPDWFYLLSKVNYDPENCYPTGDEPACK